MSKELVKHGGGQVSKADYEKSVSIIRGASRNGGPVQPVMVPERSVLAASGPGQIVDLPRICAVHDKAYAARYVRQHDGRFRLGCMIGVTEALYLRQYAGNGNAASVPNDDIAEETCPMCGACGHGSVLCGGCKAEVCFGRTAGRYFRCRPSCRGEGVMQRDRRNGHGVMPVSLGGRWSA